MLPYAALVADWVLTAWWPLIGRAGLGFYSPIVLLWAGLVVGLVSLGPALAFRGRWRRVISASVAPSLIGMAFFSGVAMLIYISTLKYTTPVNAVIVAQVEVFYSALISAYLLGERLTVRQSLASSLVIAGTALIVLRDLQSPRWRGDLMIFFTPWMYQLSHVVSKKLPKDLDAITLSGGRVFYGALLLAPLATWSLMSGAHWSWEPRALRLLIAQGLFASSLNYTLWYVAIRRLDLSKSTTMLLSYPALTLGFSWSLGREAITLAQIFGLLCTFSGAVWTAQLSWARHRELAVNPR